MGFLSKDLIIKAYESLSNLTADHKQGQTQIVSLLRYVCALDRFCVSNDTDNCDLNNAVNRDEYTQNVVSIVNIEGLWYTTNFYDGLKQLEDAGVGSNFYSAGVVSKSKENTSTMYDYPTRGSNPVFQVKNNTLYRDIGLYSNVSHFLSNDDLKCGFIIWLSRNNEIDELTLDGLCQSLLDDYSDDLIKELSPNVDYFNQYIGGYTLEDNLSILKCSDIPFVKTNSASTIIPGIQHNVLMEENNDNTKQLLTAIRTKPFILLAGISGTGKSRIVRKLAQATTTKELQEYQGDDFDDIRWQIHTPENFEIIQVKPNWHNSMDVLGYLSNIPSPHYVLTPLVNFIIKAWKHKDIPFFLCLDEMNLAPVEEYFAEFLSAIESRSIDENGDYWTDALVKPFRDFGQEVYNDIMPLITRINPDATRFADHGLTLPPNLIVIGTVNMDETTFSFSRKVLDRAMSIEMNEVDYDNYISGNTDDGIKAVAGIENLSQLLVDRHIEAKEFVSEMSDAQNVIDYLKKINTLLEGTPFKLGYRAANEALIYVKSAQEFGCADFRKSLDEFTLMKILSRLEGDEQKLAITDSEFDNAKLSKAGVDPEKAMEHDGLSILSCLWEIIENNLGTETKSVDKIKSMISQLRRDHFVSYWN